MSTEIIIGKMKHKWDLIIPNIDLDHFKPEYIVVYYKNLKDLSNNKYSIALPHQKTACLTAKEQDYKDKPYRYIVSDIQFNLYPMNSVKTMFIMTRENFTFAYLQIRQKKYIKLPDNMVVQLGTQMINNIYYDFQNHCLTRNVDMDGNLNKGIDEEWL